ncbi:hypothetical protein R3P38DRAFT_3038244 [Favolaschia claudopus]|uniref:Uncharacterized protein n=1 Tax=Favolaschia claudopus TaxID=2862362 RepID=A0AAW0AB34_9AGAR
MLGGGVTLVSVGLGDEGDGGGGRVVNAASHEGVAVLENGDEKVEEKDEGNVVRLIVIHQRSPSPAFSVTSRPAHAVNRSLGAAVELGGRSGQGGGMALQTREGERSGSTVMQPAPASSSSSTVTGAFRPVERSEALTASFSTSTAGSTSPHRAFSSSMPLTDVRGSARTLPVEREISQRLRSSTITPLVH